MTPAERDAAVALARQCLERLAHAHDESCDCDWCACARAVLALAERPTCETCRHGDQVLDEVSALRAKLTEQAATIARLKGERDTTLKAQRDDCHERRAAAERRAEQAEQETEKWRGAARVLCAAHVGVPQAMCPVCRAKRAEAERDALTARVAELEARMTLLQRATRQAMSDDAFAHHSLRGIVWVLVFDQPPVTAEDEAKARELIAALKEQP